MASKERQDWQKFKRDYPAFAKAREVKTDLGPMLDKHLDKRVAFHKSVKPAMESVVKTIEAYNKLLDACKDCEKAAKDAGNADLEETFKINGLQPCRRVVGRAPDDLQRDEQELQGPCDSAGGQELTRHGSGAPRS